MATAKKTCRVCGKEYEACRSVVRNVNVFRWQDVACSPECGAIYLARINESRGVVDAPKKVRHKKPVEVPAAEPVVSEETAPVEICAEEE